MSEYYQFIPKRLLEYRKKQHLTQMQMGDVMGIKQDHYGKLEKGTVILSYDAMMLLEERLGGVYYLITGLRLEKKTLAPYFSVCENRKQAESLMKLLIWATDQGIILSEDKIDIPYHYKKEIELQYGDECKEHIWKRIRVQEALSQKEMATILDIDVKRYRVLEKGEIKPDGYILANLYANLGYSPMAVLRDSGIVLEGLSYIWEKFSDEILEKLNQFVEAGIKLLRSPRA